MRPLRFHVFGTIGDVGLLAPRLSIPPSRMSRLLGCIQLGSYLYPLVLQAEVNDLTEEQEMIAVIALCQTNHFKMTVEHEHILIETETFVPAGYAGCYGQRQYFAYATWHGAIEDLTRMFQKNANRRTES